MRKEELADYANKYVGLRLSCGTTAYGKLKVERTIGLSPTSFFLNEADSYLNETVESMLKGYLSVKRNNAETHSYQIAPEHVTLIRDISDLVEEALQEKKT